MTKRKRKRRAKRKAFARQNQSKKESANLLDIFLKLGWRIKPVKLTDYFEHFDKAKHQHLKFLLVARVSDDEQVLNGDLKRQENRLKKFAKENNLNTAINGEVIDIINGAFWSPRRRKRAELEFQKEPILSPLPDIYTKPHYFELGILARWIKGTGIAFLFESVDRAIRSSDYDFNNKDAPISKRDLEDYKRATLNNRSITICNLEATSNQVDSFRKTFGEKNKEPRKPRKTKGWRLRRYAKYHDKVIRLKFKKGLSYQQVFKKLKRKVPKSSIIPWCQEYQKKQKSAI